MDEAQSAEARRPDVAVVGEINSDLILYGLPAELPEEREILATDFTMTLGSSSAILAHNLALLGSKVTFSSRVGPDALGEMCCRRLSEAGVDISRVVRRAEGSSTGVTLILPLAKTRRILTYPGVMFEMGMGDLDLGYLSKAKHFHMSSLFLHRGLTPDIPDLFAEMKRRGLTTSLDTNDDPEGQWDGVLHSVLREVDVLFCNEQELANIARTKDVGAAACMLSSAVSVLVVKRGGAGASAFSEGRRIDAPAIRVQVTDTVGAGDTFDAGFLHKWVRRDSLDRCLSYGNLAGALSVTRPGGTEAFRDTDYRENFLAANS